MVRESVEEYKYHENVREVSTTIDLQDEETINCELMEAKVGDIIIGKDSTGENVAYKITELTDDGKNAKIAIPALDEIYAELNIYGEYTWDVNDIDISVIEEEVSRNVKKSDFFDRLMITAYADDQKKDGAIKTKITPNPSNQTVTTEITITLKPGENGLFGISKLKHQQVSLKLTATIGCKLDPDFKSPKEWDISVIGTYQFAWEVNIEFLHYESDNLEKGLDELLTGNGLNKTFNDYYQKGVKEIANALNKVAAETEGKEIKLFDWTFPVPAVPLVTFEVEIKLFVEFEMSASITIGNSTETINTVGLKFDHGKFKTYTNTYKGESDVSLLLQGKAEVKAGIKLVIQLNLVSKKIANIHIDPQAGLYAQLFVTIPIAGVDRADNRSFIYSYFEPGIYFGCDIKATLNLVMKKYEYTHEMPGIELPFEAFTFGNKKIAVGFTESNQTVRALENKVAIPKLFFEYYDVKEECFATDTIDPKDMKFVLSGGEELKYENGKLQLPSDISSGSVYVIGSYKHTDGREYNSIISVLVSGCGLEGKVSAENATTDALQGANVSLYSVSDTTTPIKNTKTDNTGKFKFNVSAGEYILEISADGYRTLTSRQVVNEDEIKYTEHILLIDNGQSGTGSAGGKVTNAVDGNGVADVTLRFRNDWNNKTGSYCDFETMTNSYGEYSIENVPVGYYTIEASHDGFVTGYSNISVLSEGVRDNFDFTITPQLNENEIRIVLSWGEYPLDLDSHLIGRTPSNESFNVYYENKQYTYQGVEMANLDVDDTSSYGPETITILQRVNDKYVYAVHDYSDRGDTGSTNLSYSGAVVKVFIGSHQVQEYHVPTDHIGTYWTVFTIDASGRIVPINEVSNEKPTV